MVCPRMPVEPQLFLQAQERAYSTLPLEIQLKRLMRPLILRATIFDGSLLLLRVYTFFRSPWRLTTPQNSPNS